MDLLVQGTTRNLWRRFGAFATTSSVPKAAKELALGRSGPFRRDYFTIGRQLIWIPLYALGVMVVLRSALGLFNPCPRQGGVCPVSLVFRVVIGTLLR